MYAGGDTSLQLELITDYKSFLKQLRKAGFSLSGDSAAGFFSFCESFSPAIRWHTGDGNTDPWAFRMRVLDEGDIGYGKFFLQKGGYITREWAPCFLALKRQGYTWEEWYQRGRMSYLERNIMSFVAEQNEASFIKIKAAVGGKGLEAALGRLQTDMFLTISGETRRLSKENMPYGWPVTTFCLAEDFWGGQVMAEASSITVQEAKDRISQRVFELNPSVEKKALERFLA
jgi:hypothetical protein